MTSSSGRIATSAYRRQLWGWLSYAFASEVFAVCSLALFLPLCLEQFARDNGYLLPDRTIPCSTAATIPTPSSAAPSSDARCVVKLGWLWIDSASFSLYVYSASVAMQALTVISMGAVADHPIRRKFILLGFAGVGSVSAFLFLPLSSTSRFWFLSAILAVLANVGFGASMVALNAYLPGLARSSPDVVAARNELDRLRTEDHSPQTEDAGVDLKEAAQSYNALVSRTTSKTSSLGIAIGYAGGITLLLLTLIPLILMRGSTFSLRLGIALSGAWWFVFTIPAAVWLPGGWSISPSSKQVVGADEEEEQLLQSDENVVVTAQQPWSLWAEVKNSWRGLGAMLKPKEAKRLRNTFSFLAAWFLLSDGFTSITSTAMLFAKTTLHIPSTHLVIMGVLGPASGIAGSLLWPKLQRRWGWTNLRALVALILVASVVPFYGCLGFLPFMKNAPFGGLTAPGEMWVAVIYFGSIYGAFQGYARSVFAEMIPHGEEAKWYGLYSITDKSSSFLGPLVVGLIADATGNIRYGFFFLIFMVLLPVPILIFGVDVDQGREDAAQYAAERDAQTTAS